MTISGNLFFNNFGLKVSVGFLLIALLSFTYNVFTTEGEITIYMVGDSTMSEKDVRYFPETGWGTPFADYFEDNVRVENHARSGRSSRTFLEEGRWEPIVNNLKEGDYVFIQFGHNDEVQSKPQSTTPEQFTENLKKYINETEDKGATPVLLTSIARRSFDENGDLQDTHKEFADLTRQVAKEKQVAFIDLDRISRELLTELGPEKSKFLYLHLEPGQNPNYPEGVEDNTHFNEYGARRMAELVLSAIKDLNIELGSSIAGGSN